MKLNEALQSVIESDSAFQAGKKAKEDGKSLRENPYEAGSADKIKWMRGYRAARKEKRVEKLKGMNESVSAGDMIKNFLAQHGPFKKEQIPARWSPDQKQDTKLDGWARAKDLNTWAPFVKEITKQFTADYDPANESLTVYDKNLIHRLKVTHIDAMSMIHYSITEK